MSDLLTNINDKDLRVIADKNHRQYPNNTGKIGLFLYKNADLALLGLIARYCQKKAQ